MKKLIATLYLSLVVLTNILPMSLAHVSASGANLIANSSVETVDPSNSADPQNWLQGNWGTNTTTFSYPTTGHTGGRSVKVQISNYTSGDAKWYFTPVTVTPGTNYTFSDYYQSNILSSTVAQFDDGSGNMTYQSLSTAPVASSWATTSASFMAPASAKYVSIFHLINAVGWLQIDDSSLTAATAQTAPTVSLTAPAANATVGNQVQLTASASDNVGIAGVQFKVDGTNVGSEVLNAPYQTNWDTSQVSNGPHTITAVARNTGGLTTTSSPVQVTVSNNVSGAGGNLISNPSVESADPNNSNVPASWSQGGWGTNTTTFSYVSGSGHTGTHSLKVQTTKYTNGDAKWYFSPVAVTPGTQYTFSDYYTSTIASSLVAQFDNGTGGMTYQILSNPAVASSWTLGTTTFTAPTGAKYVTVFHLIAGVGTLTVDDASLTTSTAPTVSVTSPIANATVNGQIQIAATASAHTTISGVQFKVDGVNQGAAVSSAPYQVTWDTKLSNNGLHSVTAIVTTADNQTATSPSVSVNVNNQATTSSNLIPNPSLETADPANSKLPQSWNSGTWGTNKTTFSYLSSGHTGKRSVKTQITSYTSGSSYWYVTNQSVVPGQIYDFTDYYEANAISEIDAGITMSDGSIQYLYIGDASPSANSWTKFETQFTVPAGAISVTFYHNIYSVGWLTTDDYSLTPFSYQGFKQPLVSLTFDDGYASFFNNGLPLLKKYNFASTDYIITGVVDNDPAYMTMSMLKQLQASGQEVSSHTVTHPDLTTLSATNMDKELKDSQASLQSWLGISVKDFASPYGAYNQQVVNDAKKYYTSYRGVQEGYNAKNNFDAYNILVKNIVDTTTPAQVDGWINTAKATNTWLVLVYHQVDPSSSAGTYNTYPSDLDAELSYLKSTGIKVDTVGQALAELEPQL